MRAVGCIAVRICNSNNCPMGVATQKPEPGKRLARHFGASVALMQVLARARGHGGLSGFTPRDIAELR